MVQTWRLRKAAKMSSVCIKLLVIAVTLSLSDVACQTVHDINISGVLHTGRQRRQAQPLTQQQISSIVNRHNILRSREGAANMKLMVWNTSLASEAANWAARCQYGHSTEPVGQNIFTTTAHRADISVATQRWYNQKKHYNINSKRCRPQRMCGHYTQVVWANTDIVGCGVHRCPQFTYVVCNYLPAGNVYKHLPYKKGPACSKCASGAGWCKNKLCNWQCTSAGEGCSCAAICYNCAELDTKTCRCKCGKGWHGVDCSERCKDTHKRCGREPGWHLCNNTHVKRKCPALCGLCEINTSAAEGSCPPVLGPGAVPLSDSAQTMFIKSHQSTMIFVIMVIIAFTIISYDAL